MENLVSFIPRRIVVFLIVVTIIQLLPTVTTFEGERDYAQGSCQNTTHPESSLVAKIKSHECINLYKGKGCEGWFVRWQPSHLFDSIEGEAAHVWNNDNDLVTSHLVVGSMGPCLDACDPKNWDNLNLNETVNVTVYDDKDFKGNRGMISVSPSACSLKPSNVKRVESVKILGPKSSCIELHDTYDCSGENYTILRPGYPMLNDMRYHGMNETTHVAHFEVKAVSLCGKYCNSERKAVPQVTTAGLSTTTPTKATTQKPPEIFQGERENLDVTIVSGRLSSSVRTASFNVNSCVNLPSYLLQKLSRISSNYNKCLNLYAKQNCQGRVIRWQPHLYLNDLTDSYHRWFHSVSANDSVFLKSVGPCKNKCDPEYREGSKGLKEVEVTLFDDKFGYVDLDIVNKTVLKVKPGDCLGVPRGFRSKAIKITGNDACVELHKASHCGDPDYALLREDYPYLQSLNHYGMRGYSKGTEIYTRAVSLCGAFCDRKWKLKEVKDPPVESQGNGVVTIFDYNGFYGYPTHYDLSQGCVNLTQNAFNTNNSIWTNGNCIVLFGSKGCKKESVFTTTLQTSGKPAEYYMEKIKTFTFPLIVKSMRLCDETEFSYSPIEKPEETSTITNAAVATEASTGTIGISVVTQESKGYTAWFYCLVVFSLLIYTALIATMGALISSTFQAHFVNENAKNLAVSYNSRNSEGTDKHL